MAILSGKIKIISIVLVILACRAGYVLAADAGTGTAAKTPPTQPATEVFDVKEKDVPPPAAPAASGGDIPPPDFKEFEDNKFINNLIGDDGKPVSKSSAKKETKADNSKPASKVDDLAVPPANAAPGVPDKAKANPDEIIDNMLSGGDGKKPAAEATKKTDAVPVPDGVPPIKADAAAPNAAGGIVDAAKPNSEAVAPADVPQVPTAAIPQKKDDKPAVVVDNSKNPDLSDKEKSSYEELKKHLLGFVSSSKGQSTDSATSETKDGAAPVAPAANDATNGTPPAPVAETPATNTPPVTGETPKTPAMPPVAEKPATEVPVNAAPAIPAEAPVAPPSAADAKTPPVPAAAQANTPAVAKEDKKVTEKKPAPVDAFDDFLEPEKKEPAKVPEVVVAKPEVPKPEEKKVEAVKPETKDDKIVKAPAPAEVKTAEPAVKTDKTGKSEKTAKADKADKKSKTAKADKAKKLSPEKPKEINVGDEDKDQSELKEKPSEADKAYFKLLEKKRESLPNDKRLSDGSKDAIEGASSELAPVKLNTKKNPQYIKLEHGNMGAPMVEEDGMKKSQSKMDLSVRKIGKNEDYEKSKVKLEKAYKALLVGQISAAISIYKDIIEKEPDNIEAMFGLATAYHKNSQFDQARAIYTTLLKKDPGNKEALNNFLVLVAEEAPEDALIELEKLERVNNDFSPVQAQIAMINLRLGNTDKAVRYLRRAILLSPDNISYKYNLAITYDKLGNNDQAIQLYHQIVEAVRGGAIIPGSIDKLVERMTYLEGKLGDKSGDKTNEKAIDKK